MILLMISFIFLVCSLILFYIANQIKINKNKEQQEYAQHLQELIKKLEIKIENLLNSNRKKEIQLQNKYTNYEQDLEKKLNQKKLKGKQEIKDYLDKQKEIIEINIKEIKNQAYQEIACIHMDLDKTRESAQKEKQQIKNDLNKLKASLNAGVEARLREQEKKDKINFYKLSISDADLADVKMLQNLKSSFHKPVVLSKLIWTQYFQKQMTQLCDRVFGKKPISGIYKITDLITEECYIGQSVNIQQRMKQHCKCGLGIEASATNKLYNTMQKDKVWNFSFELLEQCSKESLNEKEKFWIQMYQSNKFGLNTMKGNS